MKKIFVLLLSLAPIYAMDADTEIVNSHTYAELVLARMRWAGNEDMLIHTQQKENVCLTSCTDHQKLAYLDNKHQVITTYYKYNGTIKTITHSHEEFKRFLHNSELKHHVHMCGIAQKNLANLCTIQ